MIARTRALLSRLRTDTAGATIIEFAMIAPTFCLLLLASLDFSHTLFTRVVIQGMIQKTARDSTLEMTDSAATQAALDTKVRNQLSAFYKDATVTISRRYYRTFTDAAAARAEAFTDTNSNGRCDAREPYEDANGNSVWDADGGNEGQGGAKDATLYTVTMTYPELMPLRGFLGGNGTTSITTQTILRNQPYGDQGSYGTPVVRNCT